MQRHGTSESPRTKTRQLHRHGNRGRVNTGRAGERLRGKHDEASLSNSRHRFHASPSRGGAACAAKHASPQSVQGAGILAVLSEGAAAPGRPCARAARSGSHRLLELAHPMCWSFESQANGPTTARRRTLTRPRDVAMRATSTRAAPSHTQEAPHLRWQLENHETCVGHTTGSTNSRRVYNCTRAHGSTTQGSLLGFMLMSY